MQITKKYFSSILGKLNCFCDKFINPILEKFEWVLGITFLLILCFVVIMSIAIFVKSLISF